MFGVPPRYDEDAVKIGNALEAFDFLAAFFEDSLKVCKQGKAVVDRFGTVYEISFKVKEAK
jgi:hypothetical protein